MTAKPTMTLMFSLLMWGMLGVANAGDMKSDTMSTSMDKKMETMETMKEEPMKGDSMKESMEGEMKASMESKEGMMKGETMKEPMESDKGMMEKPMSEPKM